MLAALDEFFPREWGVTWTRPQGGLFLWMHLPEGVDCRRLLEAAIKENVAFVPGDAFFASEDEGRRYCRLNFSNATPEMILEGVHRLAQAVQAQLKTGGHTDFKVPSPNVVPN
jgi:2-aminoadipate transaminase